MKKIVIIVISILLSCSHAEKKQITIFHAGSLSSLMKECKQLFEKQNRKYTVLLESSGSVDAARKLTDLNRHCEIIALADVELFDSMLQNHCAYAISFAGNEMVLAYAQQSKYAKAIAANWVDALIHNDIVCTRSDPLRDPCGYRTLMVWKLAGMHYNNPQLEKICAQRSPQKFVRPKEMDCVALLETMACDALWIYKSVALQHKFPYVTFDDHINLSKPNLNSHYKKACILLHDAKKSHTFCGSAITYGISIPDNAENKEGAMKFLLFLLGKEGRGCINRNGFNSIEPYSKQWDKLPEELKKVVKRVH